MMKEGHTEPADLLLALELREWFVVGLGTLLVRVVVYVVW
jgi:hypothetical protein